MCLYEVLLAMSLLDFGIGTILANDVMCGIMLLLEQFKHAREEYQSKRTYVI